jgi:hypothetical protein
MSGRIEAFRTAVAARINVIAPELRSVEAQFGRFDLDELERTSMRCPAVRLSILRAPLVSALDGKLEAQLYCVAFVITDGKDKDRFGWNIAEAIATQLHSGQLWGLTRLAAPTDREIQPVVTGKLRDRGVSIIAVEWRQTLRQLGENIFDDNGVMFDGAYLNGEEVELDQGGANE